jgi:hypothetical protein|tara:strand:+ start:102 stop:707 length:606 start_codon:yes stop_codon:yes gene_type:complete
MSLSKKAVKNAYSRHGDQAYYLSKYLSALLLEKKINPIFTKENEKMKLKIFGIDNIKICFISGKPVNGVGDHFYEINGYHKKTGKRGIDDPWNILPVCGALNKSYKIFKFKMNGKNIKKNIGYEPLTMVELGFLIDSDEEEYREMAEIYCKIYEWRTYVEQQEAIICYEEDESFKEIRAFYKQEYKKLWDKTFEFIESKLN